ncbi:hypothetical protein PA25_10340 [Pseudoalteromonas sp. A25]|nr:hypothetical protein PA25_10340 [Pseudoalteromonas sp. A25]
MTGFAQVIEPLNFGSLVIPRNNEHSSITIYPDSHIQVNGLYVYERGNPAIMVFDSLSPGTQVFISDNVSNARLTGGSDGQYFLIEKLHYRQSHIVNQHGELTLLIGATLKTSANGNPYFDGRYTSIVEISLDY